MARRMHAVIAPRRSEHTLHIHVDPNNVARGHQLHRSGAGHHDSRPRRQRTRRAAFRAATAD